jgi:hypothetical protein
MIKANIIIKFFIMKKQFLNLGKALNKAEQKSINGGVLNSEGCDHTYACQYDEICTNGGCVKKP